ncbi:MAG TPA: trypsin-like peptidase domain-containing protein, partial [Thermomicrobiales bacterium]|nr:trypsin-like peptidase domain-containing protein [Thermomicrobiales bacterium]
MRPRIPEVARLLAMAHVFSRRLSGMAAIVVSLLLLSGCLGPVAPAPTPVAPTLVPTGIPKIPGGLPPGPATPLPAGAAVSAAVVDTADVVARVTPAVVTVVNEQSGIGFGRGQAQEAGRGTGFIISSDGYIVTNNHVVAGGDQFEVILNDGTKRPAKLVGADPLSDIAVVQIEQPVPAVVAFGDSDRLRPGEPVLAIGSPLGEFTGTVTEGIVSALHRDFPGSPGQGEPGYTNLIQHDAPINPGNSGGPLFDLQGRVIGVNTLGIPVGPNGVPAQGLFFAIPSNSVQGIVSQLINQGRVRYPYLGIQYEEIVPEIASLNDLPVNYGAYITNVVSNGPAAKAGIQANDIILAVGDKKIDAQTRFSEALFAYQP